MSAPKALAVDKPVKLIFAGGFLGSGKTTALAALTRDLIGQGKRVGIVTNDQSENLADTLIARQMLEQLGVPVQEVVAGCFCCRFDELIDEMEKILAHDPDFLMGEPVGSCTDFVAAVANPIKIHYREAFTFAPFSTMVDPRRLRELLFKETATSFPQEVAYLFKKQLEEADIIALNKIDLLTGAEKARLVGRLVDMFPDKKIMPVSAKTGAGMDRWLQDLVSSRPGADTVLQQIDYDRYARAEAVLGWLNAAVKLQATRPFQAGQALIGLMVRLRDLFRRQKAGIGHLKCVLTAGGDSMWVNLTDFDAEPSLSDHRLGAVPGATLIVNARVQISPDLLEAAVRRALAETGAAAGFDPDVIDLQCFSPAYPNPPYLVRDADAAPKTE